MDIMDAATNNEPTKNEAVNTTFYTCFHVINALLGVGILSIPYALASGGWLSLILFLVIAFTTFYCSLLIQRCMDRDVSLKTYPDIGHKAFGNKGRLIVSISIHLELYLVMASFLILEGDNLNKLFGLGLKEQRIFVIVVVLFILPLVWWDDLKILSYVSASGVLASIVIIASIVWVGAFGGIGFQNKGSEMIDLKGITTSVSLYVFCYGAHPVFPTIYTSMKNKHQFQKVMTICFTLCTMMYGLMATFGYLMFGSQVQSSITLDLPTQKLSSKIAIYTMLVIPIAKYPLMVTPIVNAIRSRISGLSHGKATGIIGTTLVISNLAVALLVPFFGSLVTLVGAFLIAFASVILPCLCYLKISGNYKRFEFETLVLVGIILMGIIVMITGTYQAVSDMIGHL